MGRVVISEFMDERAVARLAERHDVLFDPALVDDAAGLLRAAAGADALIVRNRTQVRGALLAALAPGAVVGRLGVGLDNIDVDACAARGIAVVPATGANALAVAEYVVGAALLLLRGAYRSTAEIAAGGWPRQALGSGREIGAKTMGLVGFGSIGRITARLAQGVGMRVVATDAMLDAADAAYRDVGVDAVGLDELLASADVVSLHVPLLEATRDLMNAARIAAMKPGAVLVNTARGGIVDEAAVAAALRSGRLGGAALDVFAREPLAADHPFAGCPNLLLTPHIAGVTAEANERVSLIIADRVLEALA
ncbi:MAG: hydroxyacid dehydrogenase [Caldimonas sp.]